MKLQLSLTAMVISEVFVPTLQAAAPQNKQNAKQQRPNILFCIADDASYAHFSANGSKWVHTPNFDKLAKNGILFSNCYTANGKSAPSRACVLTGLYSWQAREAGNHVTNFPPDLKVFTEALAENGYDIAWTGKGWAPGSARKSDGSERSLTGQAFQKHKLSPPTSEISTNDYAGNFSDFLKQNKGGKPWMFWFGATEPHRAYENGTGEKIGGKLKNMIDDFPSFWPDNDEVRTDMLDYGFEIEYFDKQIGRMVKELEKRGILDNTIIVVTSDNGMPFPRCKANDYEYSNHMPLVVMWKNGIKNPGRTVSDYINFVDFAPTFLDVSQTDLKKSGMETSPGHSLNSIFKSSKSGRVDPKRHYTLLGRERDDYGRPQNQGYPIRGIVKDNFLYINNLKPQLFPAGNIETGYLDVDGSPTKTIILNMKREGKDSTYYNLSFAKRKSEELYNLSIDKFCVNNLADNPTFLVQKKELKKLLFDKLKSQHDPRVTGNGDVFDNYAYDIKGDEAWNFWEKVVNGEIKKPWEKTKWVNPSDYDSYYYEIKNK